MRLIDAETLIRRAIERYKKAMGTDIGHGMGVIASMITDAPTIDAVPVVRCKDCDHKHAVSCEGVVLCTYRGKMIQMKPNDFCSYGKRKETNR